MKSKNLSILEWSGVLTAILYTLLVALNIGTEFYGFSLLVISAFFLGIWSYLKKYNGIFLLQIFYASAGMIGVIRWFGQ